MVVGNPVGGTDTMLRFMFALFFAFTLALGYSTSTSAQDLLNCADFATQAEAQANADATGDVNNLDDNDDGVACENYSYGGGAPAEAMAVEAPVVEAAPVEAVPVEAAPVEPAPVEAAPVEPAPRVTRVPSTGVGLPNADGPLLMLIALTGVFGLAALRARRAV
jgi:hypothetical protein